MKPTVYYRAAEYIAEGNPQRSCFAIRAILRNFYSPLYVLELYKTWYAPNQSYINFDFGEVSEENQLARSLALLFMDQIEKDALKAEKLIKKPKVPRLSSDKLSNKR